jgi:hypothetical protein
MPKLWQREFYFSSLLITVYLLSVFPVFPLWFPELFAYMLLSYFIPQTTHFCHNRQVLIMNALCTILV